MRFRDKFLLGAWNVGIVESGFEDIFNNPRNMKIRWLQHKYRDRYFADPFLCGQDEKNYYILVEELIFYEDKGKIARLTIDKKTMKLVHKEIILNESHHLSYPYIYDDYIIPEGYRSGAAYAYKSVKNGEKYQKIKISDHALVDPTLLKYDNKYWLFATTKKNTQDALQMLSIFYSDKLGGFAPHALDPVKIDIKTARPGGRFFEYQGKLFRPVQDCEESYGHFIRIMEVKKLSVNEYEETEVMVLSSQDSPPYDMGFHTFNVYKNCIVVDGYREYYSYFLKPCFVKLKKLLLFIYKWQNNKGKEII